jgi:inhibitor of cysteine peptidase
MFFPHTLNPITMKKTVQVFILCSLLLFSSVIFAQGFVQATLNNADQAITLQADQLLEIKLPSTPSTGYGWFLKENSNARLITQVEQSTFQSDGPDNLEGNSGNQIIRYKPTDKGVYDLELEYRRPWESNNQVMASYKLQVNCEGAYNGSYVPVTLEESIIQPQPSRALPSAFSWVPQCSPVKNQGSCGSCWSFATEGSFEAVINIWDNVIRDLSEQWLVNCDNGANGCGGGTYAYKMFVNNGGVYETDLPYKGKDGTCGTSYTYHEKAKTYGTVTNNVDKMKQALYDYGPMYVSICAGSNLQAYKTGVITKTDGTQTNHGVVLCGWNDTDGCWIIKNSWGASFGEKGYFRIKYGLSAVGTKVAYVDYKGKIPHTPTGISVNQHTDISIYPNPSNDGQFTINGLKNSNKLEVIDVLGKVVQTLTISENTYKMDISNLNKGIYFYKITNLETHELTQGKLLFN